MKTWSRCYISLLFVLFLRPCHSSAQGTREDYQRAEQFRPGNLRHRMYVADVAPHWIAKKNRFWYRKQGTKATEFILVDAEQNITGPAELGFVAVMIDSRGTTGRSRAFHEFSYHNLGGSFEDHVEMIKQMAAKCPYMDVDRVGIYGTSAGGYGSTHAILSFPDFYKVCVSISGDHDTRLDKAWWNELYQGYPVGPDYAEQSNVTMADRLKGHLLIEHGDIDDNVHVVETMRLTDALIKANKNFEQLIVPNMYHGEGGNPYLIRRRWDYFVQNLLGVTPPPGFAIHEEREAPPARAR